MTIEEAMPATGITGIIEKTHGAIESAMEFIEDRESPWIPFYLGKAWAYLDILLDAERKDAVNNETD